MDREYQEAIEKVYKQAKRRASSSSLRPRPLSAAPLERQPSAQPAKRKLRPSQIGTVELKQLLEAKESERRGQPSIKYSFERI